MNRDCLTDGHIFALLQARGVSPENRAIVKAMIAGRFSCRYCTQGHLRNEETEYECVLCDVLECGLSFPDEHFCEQWTEREDS